MKTYENANCLPMRIYKGQPARIVATRYFDHSNHHISAERSTWGTKYYDLDVFANGQYTRLENIPACLTSLPEDIKNEPMLCVSQGMSAVPVRLVKK